MKIRIAACGVFRSAPDLWDQACKIAQFLNLRLQVKEADYTDLKRSVERQIQQASPFF